MFKLKGLAKYGGNAQLEDQFKTPYIVYVHVLFPVMVTVRNTGRNYLAIGKALERSQLCSVFPSERVAGSSPQSSNQ